MKPPPGVRCNGHAARVAAIVFVASIAALVGCSDPRPPNIVIIALDTTRADFLSAYGHPKPTSPEIDRIASEGVQFDHAYSTAFWTLPSHASLFTGTYPSEHGATSETNHLATDRQTLAETLRAAGYATAAFVSNVWVNVEHGFSQGFDVFVETWRDAPSHASGFAVDKHGIALAREFIAARSRDGRPFFLFLNLNSVHLPYSPDPLALVDLTPEMRPTDRVARLRQVSGMWSFLAGQTTFDETDYQILRELYEAEILMVDGLVGELRADLETRGMLDDTLLVVTADHGENIGDHGLIDHLLSMYESTVHIPLIMRLPGTFAAGSHDESLVSIVDIAPTALAVAGLDDAAAHTSGRNLAAKGSAAPAYVILENDRPINAIEVMQKGYPGFDTTDLDRRVRVLHSGRYKLVWYSDDQVELYDLEADPGETTDLSDAEPEVRDELLASLRTWIDAHGEQAALTTRPELDAKAREQLRALGYIED